jgi:hypothetical protein
MRFQAEIPTRDQRILSSLMRDLEIQSNAELLAHLISIARWAVVERRQGRRIASLGAQGPVRELVSPLLERVAPEHQLPCVEIHWTPEELANLAALASAEPAMPAEPLRGLMRRS